MTELTGRAAKQLQRELDDLIYRNPNGGEWETADHYLSGNVRQKLKAAESASNIDPSYRRNVDALKAVQPPDFAARRHQRAPWFIVDSRDRRA